MILLLLIGYLLALVGIGTLVNWLLVPIFGRSWRLFVAPGVIVHELSHALAAVATGAQVVEINFWKPSGGHVAHTQPRLQIIGPVLISYAPLLVMTTALFFIAPILSGTIGNLTWTTSVPTSLGGFIFGYVGAIVQAFRSFNWLTIVPWLLTYAMLNVAVTITPSAPDFHNSKWAFLGCIILGALLVNLLSWNLDVNYIWQPLATSLVLLGMAAVVVIMIAGVWRAMRSFLSSRR